MSKEVKIGRPEKEGLDWYKRSPRMWGDEKLSAIQGEFGLKGRCAVDVILDVIYDTKGYYVMWSDLNQGLILTKLNKEVSKGLLNEVVNRLVAYEFFDKDLFNSSSVLTSQNIQDRYFAAIKKRNHQPTKFRLSDS